MIWETSLSRYVDENPMEIHSFSDAVGSGYAMCLGMFPR